VCLKQPNHHYTDIMPLTQICCLLLAQANPEINDWDIGIRAGLSYQVGTQSNRTGFNLGTFARSNFSDTEAFLSLSTYKNFSHIQTSEPGRESQISIGITQGFGLEKEDFNNYDWSLSANNTHRNNSVSLYLNIYIDTYETSQRTLGLGANIGDLNVRLENDYDPTRILGDYGDRYRTAAVEVGYLVSNETQLIAGINLFTGEPGEGGFLSREAGGTGRYGSYTMIRADGSDVTARDRSVGNAYVGLRGLNLASSEFERAIGLDDLQIKVGWSSEAIRGATQNQFHDLIRYPHIPLRDSPGKLYLELGTNHGQTLYP